MRLRKFYNGAINKNHFNLVYCLLLQDNPYFTLKPANVLEISWKEKNNAKVTITPIPASLGSLFSFFQTRREVFKVININIRPRYNAN